MTRYFRGDIYEIFVDNSAHVQKGVTRIEVDGESIEGDIIPVIGDGKRHVVRVYMG